MLQSRWKHTLDPEKKNGVSQKGPPFVVIHPSLAANDMRTRTKILFIFHIVSYSLQ